MKRLRALTVPLASMALLAAIGWGARAPYDTPGGADAVLRLSWRLRGEREETCRPRTQAELDALPVHMRTPEICEGALVAYRLIVQTDDSAPDTSRLLPAGAKGDRPLFVLKEVALAPGTHRVRIDFARDDGVNTPGAAAYSLDTVLAMRAGHIELITMDATGRQLVHLRR